MQVDSATVERLVEQITKEVLILLREEEARGQALTAGLLRVHADRMRRRERERNLAARFTSAHPGIAVTEVPARPADVHDLAGLRAVGADLAKT